MAFNPDAYLKKKKTQSTFNPDAYLKSKASVPAQEPISIPIPTQEYITAKGFGKHALEDIKKIAKSTPEIAKLINKGLTYIPRKGWEIGTDIAKTLHEQKSVMDPSRGIKEVAKKFIHPAIHPIETTKKALTPANLMSKGILEDIGHRIRHPIRTTYEEPITNLLYAAPFMPKGIRAIKKMVKGKSAQKLTKEATKIYRDMLKPGKGEIRKVEIIGKKNIDDIYKIAAEERLPISQSIDGKTLNTAEAMNLIDDKIKAIHEQITPMLANNKTQFSLIDIAQKTKDALKGKIKNASELADAFKDIDDYIGAEITLRGRGVVSAQELNKIKQGMWSVGYKEAKPTAQSTARAIGHAAKEAIEASTPNKAIKQLNTRSGDYLTLKDVLKTSHGKVIQGGKLGQYFARSTGAVTGAIAGSVLPVPGISTVGGAYVGNVLGGKVSSILNSPERLSKIASIKMLSAMKKAPKSKSLRLYGIGEPPAKRIKDILGYKLK